MAFLLALVFVAFTTLSAAAHELRPAVADLDISGPNAELSIDVTLEPLIAGLDLAELADTNDSPLAAQHDALRALPAAELEAAFRAIWPELSEKISLTAGDMRVALDLISVEVGPVGDVALPRDSRITLSGALPADNSAVQFSWDASFGAIALRHVGVDPETAYSGYLTGGEASIALPRSGASQQSWIRDFVDYIGIGFIHIVPRGLDHILFVLGLFFFSLKLRPLLWQVSAFTLAHTVTLALATLGWVNLPSSIVEPLIAASIVYVAVENIFARSYHNWRTAVVFGFGLLHGLGFASVLGDIGLNSTRFITGLIGFNIGVEIGQLTVIALAFVLIASWAGKKPWYRRLISTPASVAIALMGAFWFIERTLL